MAGGEVPRLIIDTERRTAVLVLKEVAPFGHAPIRVSERAFVLVEADTGEVCGVEFQDVAVGERIMERAVPFPLEYR